MKPTILILSLALAVFSACTRAVPYETLQYRWRVERINAWGDLGAKKYSKNRYNVTDNLLFETKKYRPFTGKAIVKDRKGFVYGTQSLKNGEPHGRTIVYREEYGRTTPYAEDECLLYEENYKNGLLHGSYKGFNVGGGGHWIETTFKNGLLHGDYIEIFQKHIDGVGLTSLEAHFENGKLHGAFKGYFTGSGEEHRLSIEMNFKHGKLHGVCRVYGNFDTYMLLLEEWYQDGEPVDPANKQIKENFLSYAERDQLSIYRTLHENFGPFKRNVAFITRDIAFGLYDDAKEVLNELF